MNKNYFKSLSKKHNTPLKVQKYLRKLNYNKEQNGETLRSAYAALLAKKAHCLEAAFIAAAILEHQGYKPQVMSLESRDNLDHVIFVYQKKGLWGSIGRSRDEGLHGRKPVFKSLKQLALSYYEPYIDKTGCIVGYQIANLDDGKSDWRFSSKNVWKLEKYLIEIRHIKIKFNKRKYKKIHQQYLKGHLAKKKSSWL
jgi:hypothetical protein